MAIQMSLGREPFRAKGLQVAIFRDLLRIIGCNEKPWLLVTVGLEFSRDKGCPSLIFRVGSCL